MLTTTVVQKENQTILQHVSKAGTDYKTVFELAFKKYNYLGVKRPGRKVRITRKKD